MNDYIPRPVLSLSVVKEVREKLTRYRFEHSAIIDRLQLSYTSVDAAIEDDLTWAHNYLARPVCDQLDILIRLFLLNVTLDFDVVAQIFTVSEIDALLEMSLLSRNQDNKLQCKIALFECAGLLIATDAIADPIPQVNAVMPLLPESYLFANLVTRKKVSSVLDLCTASGVQALLAARHADFVVGTEISSRSANFAKFNQWLNRISNVQFVEGDLFAPVANQKFDLILSIPPNFPDLDNLPGDNFYSGGVTGDIFISRIFRGLETLLKPGGICQLIHNMVVLDSPSYENRVRELLGPFGNSCDIIVLSHPREKRPAHMQQAKLYDFGLTSIKRSETSGERFYLHGSFTPSLNIDMADLFLTLQQCSATDRSALFERLLRSSQGSVLKKVT